MVRDRSPHGSVLVRSSGTLERLFGENLRDLRRRIEQAG